MEYPPIALQYYMCYFYARRVAHTCYTKQPFWISTQSSLENIIIASIINLSYVEIKITQYSFNTKSTILKGNNRKSDDDDDDDDDDDHNNNGNSNN